MGIGAGGAAALRNVGQALNPVNFTTAVGNLQKINQRRTDIEAMESGIAEFNDQLINNAEFAKTAKPFLKRSTNPGTSPEEWKIFKTKLTAFQANSKNIDNYVASGLLDEKMANGFKSNNFTNPEQVMTTLTSLAAGAAQLKERRAFALEEEGRQLGIRQEASQEKAALANIVGSEAKDFTPQIREFLKTAKHITFDDAEELLATNRNIATHVQQQLGAKQRIAGGAIDLKTKQRIEADRLDVDDLLTDPDFHSKSFEEQDKLLRDSGANTNVVNAVLNQRVNRAKTKEVFKNIERTEDSEKGVAVFNQLFSRLSKADMEETGELKMMDADMLAKITSQLTQMNLPANTQKAAKAMVDGYMNTVGQVMSASSRSGASGIGGGNIKTHAGVTGAIENSATAEDLLTMQDSVKKGTFYQSLGSKQQKVINDQFERKFKNLERTGDVTAEQASLNSKGTLLLSSIGAIEDTTHEARVNAVSKLTADQLSLMGIRDASEALTHLDRMELAFENNAIKETDNKNASEENFANAMLGQKDESTFGRERLGTNLPGTDFQVGSKPVQGRSNLTNKPSLDIWSADPSKEFANAAKFNNTVSSLGKQLKDITTDFDNMSVVTLNPDSAKGVTGAYSGQVILTKLPSGELIATPISGDPKITPRPHTVQVIQDDNGKDIITLNVPLTTSESNQMYRNGKMDIGAANSGTSAKVKLTKVMKLIKRRVSALTETKDGKSFRSPMQVSDGKGGHTEALFVSPKDQTQIKLLQDYAKKQRDLLDDIYSDDIKNNEVLPSTVAGAYNDSVNTMLAWLYAIESGAYSKSALNPSSVMEL